MTKKRNKKKSQITVVNKHQVAFFDTTEKDCTKATWQFIKISMFLALVTVVTYSGILKSDFDYYDDESYVTANDHVLKGVSWQGIKWAFTGVGYSNNWHPLTWISHMLDVQLFGLNPVGHHCMNLLLHILATLLLFGFLRYSIKELWVSAFVAMLFALHPMHVESVAWVAERKDVLSAVFWFATLWAYVYYTRKPNVGRYGLILLLFALGLMSKPMLVTLPIILLLLDYWPIGRLTYVNRKCGRLVVEKLPLFMMTIASSIITVVAQKTAMGTLEKYSLLTRIENAINSYGVYLGQLFWPNNLVVLYPYTNPLPVTVALFTLLLVTITIVVILIGKQKKYLITGWLWYIVTLIPVIGIIQVGSQAHADRYTYIPYVGIFIVIAWGIKEITDKIPSSKKILSVAIITVLIAMTLRTWDQVKYWKNGIALFSHTIEITKGNEFAHYNLGNLLLQEGRTNEAIAHYKRALEFNPDKINALNNLAGVYYQANQLEKALPLVQRGLLVAKTTGNEAMVSDFMEKINLLNKKMNNAAKIDKK